MQANKMTKDERIALVEKIFIIYPHLKEIYVAIAESYDKSRKGQKPRCFFVTGESGSGKSTLAEYFEKQFPRYRTKDGLVVPVLRSEILSPTTVKTIATGILDDLGDPLADKGTSVSKTLRLVKNIKSCDVGLIILDEFNNLIDRDTDRILKEAANWIKQLLNKTKKPIVLMGLPWSERILKDNPQLRRRFSARKDLRPFGWKTNEERKEIRALLYMVDKQLPFPERSHLASYDTAFRIFCASHGLIGYVMKIICRAAEYAIRTDSNKITLELLAKAYDEEVAAFDPNKGNPFLLDKVVLKSRSMDPFIEKEGKKARNRRTKENVNEVLTKRRT